MGFLKRWKESWRQWRNRRYIPKTECIAVPRVTEDDILRLGRTSFDKHGNARSIFPVRNKKTGRVVMFCGDACDVQHHFGSDDYEIMESPIKEENSFEVDLNADGFFGSKEEK